MSANFHPGVTNCGGTMASTGCSCPRTTTGEVDLDLMAGSVPMDATPDYSTWTPVEVDTELARLYGEHGAAMDRYNRHMGYVVNHVGSALGRGWNGKANRQEIETWIDDVREQKRVYDEARDQPDYVPGSVPAPHPNDQTALREYDNAQERLAVAQDLAEQMEPLNDEFIDRGGWTRAFLVTNQNGHVHKSMDCSSCFKPGYDNSGNYRVGTRYHWVTELSDATEAEVVKAAGSDACTVCYPSAPVEDLKRERTIFSPEEVDKQKAREEREQAKIARDKAKIEKAATADGSELVVPRGRWKEHFKTERAATTYAVDKIVDATYGWRKDQGMDPEYAEGVDMIVKSLAEKHGKTPEEIRAEFDEKAKKKAKRDGYQV
jgi:hypothetical protein